MDRTYCGYVDDKVCIADDIRTTTGALPADVCTLCAQLSIAQALEEVAEALKNLC
jgi:hypothetical protein